MHSRRVWVLADAELCTTVFHLMSRFLSFSIPGGLPYEEFPWQPS